MREAKKKQGGEGEREMNLPSPTEVILSGFICLYF